MGPPELARLNMRPPFSPCPQFTTAELGSQSRANDPNFNCGVLGASAFLRAQSIWRLAPFASSRLRLPPANPTGLGPLRMGIDVQGYNVRRSMPGL